MVERFTRFFGGDRAGFVLFQFPRRRCPGVN